MVKQPWKVIDPEGNRVVDRYQWRPSAISWALAKVRHRTHPLYVVYAPARGKAGMCTDVIHPDGRIETLENELRALREKGVHVW